MRSALLLRYPLLLALVLAGTGLANAQAARGSAEQAERQGVEPSTEAASPSILFTSSRGGQDVRRATQIVVEGETVALPGGGTGTVSVVQSALFTNRNADLGFSVDIGGDDGVWFGDGPLWLNSMAVGHTLSGAEFTMGIGDGGTFIYSPSINGNDGVWTDQGYLLADGDPAPGFGGDTLVTFNSRPTMGANGTAYWVAGLNNGAGGSTTVNRVLYMSTDRTPATTTALLRSGDVVGGFPISGGSSGILFNYEFSDDGSHHILNLDLNTGSTANDVVVYVDGAIVAQEGSPTGDNDNWQNFDILRILDDGTYGFTGDTDGPTSSDEFIAIDGAIVLREGDVVDGVTLGSSVLAFDLNDDGTVVFGWSLTSSSDEGLFVAHISDIPGTARLFARTGDLLDTDGDGAGDWLFADVNPSASTGQGAGALSPDDVFFISLGVQPVGGGAEVDGAFSFDLGDGTGGCEQDLSAALDDPNPAPGDVITFSVTVTNNAASPAPLDLWIDATGPASLTKRLASGTLPAGATVTRDIRVRVPAGAPSGAYAVDLNIGDFATGDVCDTVSFTVTVSAARVGADLTDTEFSVVEGGDFFAQVEASALSSAPSAQVSPNPFARQTAIRYEVAAPADVRLSVYDVLGRQVAVLVDGRVEAGQHAATFDARGLAAGTYVYRLQVGSEVQTGRMTLAR